MLKTLFFTLLIILPLVTSHLLYFLWINDDRFIVSWNFEFSKVIFFNIYSTILLSIWLFFIIKNKIQNTKYINKIYIFNNKIYFYLYSLFWILIISSIFWLSPETSFFGNVDKWHSSIMFINLIWLFLLFPFIINSESKNNILNIILFTTWILSVIWIKEYFVPSLNYWDLSNRLMSTLWHPNYFAWIVLLIIPYLIYNIKNKLNIINIFLWLLIIIWFLLTKSIIPLGLFVWFIWLYIFFNFNIRYKKSITLWLFILWIIWVFLISYKFWIATKLSSFISRFFIWESTLNIIFDNIKWIILWNGLDTLHLIFNKYKSTELYIFENIWFWADRPHNILLNAFYHLWLIWLILIITLYSKIIFKLKEINKENYYIISWILLVLIFLLFNFATITLYLYILIFIYFLFFNIYKNIDITQNIEYIRISKLNNYWITKYMILYILIFIISFIWSIYSILSYNKEIMQYKWINISNSIILNYNDLIKLWKYDKWLEKINIIPEIYYYSKLKTYTLNKNITEIDILCSELIKNYNSIENNFYCGDIYNYLQNERKTKLYYIQWIRKLPNLWNKNNIYQNEKWYKNAVTTHRFFHEKFWIIQKLNFLNIKIEK